MLFFHIVVPWNEDWNKIKKTLSFPWFAPYAGKRGQPVQEIFPAQEPVCERQLTNVVRQLKQLHQEEPEGQGDTKVL